MQFKTPKFAIGGALFSTWAAASALPPTSPNPHALSRRQEGFNTQHIASAVSCGGFGAADSVDNGHNVNNLNNDEAKPIAAKTCNRVGCFNTSGVYVCNDNDYDIEVTNRDAAAFAGLLGSVCVPPGKGEGRAGISGQVFTPDQGGYNVVMAYCDAANDPVDTRPDKYNFQLEEQELFTCGRDGQPECKPYHTPGAENLKVDTQENVACNVYLGANTIPAGDTYTYSTTRTVGETWTVGGYLTIDSGQLAKAAVQAGFFASFAKTTTTGSITGTSAMCGDEGVEGNFTCGLQVSPGCYRMTGTALSSYNIWVPYDTTQPKTAAGDGQGVWSASICTCGNCCDWANAGAPDLRCFEDCSTCVTLPGPCVA